MRPRHNFLFLFALAFFISPSLAIDPYTYGPDREPEKLATTFEVGSAISIASNLGLQPKVACFRDIARSWQAGVQARISFVGESTPYNRAPQVDLSVRKLWLGDEDTESVRNSEYVGAAFGGYLAYNFSGQQVGIQPYGTLSVGKYWMPFDNFPFGFDLNLELTNYISGHLPGRLEQIFVSTGLHLFFPVF